MVALHLFLMRLKIMRLKIVRITRFPPPVMP